jgi:maltooligosyltrehalose trehalohydrolase
VLGADAFVLRWFAEDGLDRLLAVNLGLDLHLDPAPEPLLAPAEGRAWRVVWSSEAIRYGGRGTPRPVRDDAWRLPARAAIALAPDPEPEPDDSEDDDAERE